MTEDECGSLPVFCDGSQCISLWRGDYGERIKFLFTGKMWFTILSGKTQPPVKLSVHTPFTEG